MAYRILVADDEEVKIRLLERILDGYNVVGACNGNEALRLYETEHSDILFIDHSMPKLTGDEVIAEIRKRGDRRTKICMMSGGTIKSDAALAAGADDFMEKPFGIDVPLGIAKKYVRELEESDRTAATC